MKKRKLDLVVISDVHLGTLKCHADELLAYFNSIDPKMMVLNGDIIDYKEFNNGFFPASHLKVLKKMIGFAASGVPVFYITGNHDKTIKKLGAISLGNFKVSEELVLELDGKKAWLSHGDIFDFSTRNSKWLYYLGPIGHALLLNINSWHHSILRLMGQKRYSSITKIKTMPKKATEQAFDFEMAAVDLAITKGFDYVLCGHTHQPKKQLYETENGVCTYLNSGDWIENMTALEYSFKRWKIYRYSNDKLSSFYTDEDLKEMDIHDIIASINRKKGPKAVDGESID